MRHTAWGLFQKIDSRVLSDEVTGHPAAHTRKNGKDNIRHDIPSHGGPGIERTPDVASDPIPDLLPRPNAKPKLDAAATRKPKPTGTRTKNRAPRFLISHAHPHDPRSFQLLPLKRVWEPCAPPPRSPTGVSCSVIVLIVGDGLFLCHPRCFLYYATVRQGLTGRKFSGVARGREKKGRRNGRGGGWGFVHAPWCRPTASIGFREDSKKNNRKRARNQSKEYIYSEQR